MGSVDPSILHFLLASGDRISSKQVLRNRVEVRVLDRVWLQCGKRFCV